MGAHQAAHRAGLGLPHAAEIDFDPVHARSGGEQHRDENHPGSLGGTPGAPRKEIDRELLLGHGVDVASGLRALGLIRRAAVVAGLVRVRVPHQPRAFFRSRQRALKSN